MSDSVLIVAAEASSALYAQRLLEEWQSQDKKIDTFGIGNQAMVDLGFEAIGRAENMAVVGFQEVLKHYSEIKQVFHKLIEECKLRKPKFVLLLDYPGFNLRLAKELHALNIPIVYYISPQIWAWKKGRIRDMQKYVDKILVLLPFEKPFYKEHDVDVEFVGHPLLDELDAFKNSSWNRQLMRSRQGINDEDFLIGLMPGSRKAEINYHLETQVKVAEKLCEKYPFVKVSLLVAQSLDMNDVKSQLPEIQFPMQIMQDQPEKMIDLCDFVLAKSGTGTLLVSLLEKPNVIMYKMNTMSALIAKFLVKGVKYFGLANLIFDKKVIPEFFQGEASVDKITAEISTYLDDSEKISKFRNELKKIRPLLGESGATKKVASELEKYFES